MATYKTGWLRLPSDPKDFKERFAWSHVKSIFYDKAKNILLKKKLDDMDGLIADHADAIANKLMTNDAFNTAIADYVTKAMMSSTQVNDANYVPTSSLAYAMQQAITANANAITQLNSDLKSNILSEDIILTSQSFKTGVTTYDVSGKMVPIPDGYIRIASIPYASKNFLLTQLAFTSKGSVYVTVQNQYGSNLQADVRCVQLFKRVK